MPLPNREDCIHACVCKYDDAMCPMDCGHFADYTPELEKARLWDKYKNTLIRVEEYNTAKEKARKLDHIANLISAFPGKQKYPQIMEAINLLRKIEGIVKEAT